MDSVVGDDPSLPGDLSSLSRLHELTGVEPGGLLGMELGVEPGGPGGLAGGTQISPTRARTMKDYEQQIAELKKENFSLKLRIYFLEERVQEGCDGATEDVYRTNIELKVEVESLKRDLREKQNLLVKASNAVETLAGSREAEISRLHQQARQEMQQLQGQLRKLQEELEQGREELGHMARLAQAERERGLELEAELGELRASHQQQLQQLQQQSSLSPPPYQPQGQQQQQLQQLAHGREAHTGRRSVAVGPNDSPERAGATEERGGRASEGPPSLAEGDDGSSEGWGSGPPSPWMRVEKLKRTLQENRATSDALIKDLQREKVENQQQQEVIKKMTEEREEEAGRLQRSAGEMAAALAKAQAEARDLQEHVRQLESAGKELQEKLTETASELRTQEQNALKRDRAIQGLSLAMKAKDKEISELCEELENRDAALVKARDATHKAQLQKFHGAEEQHALLTQKEEELCELRAATQRSLTETQRAQRALCRADERLADATAQRDSAEEEKEGAVLERQRAERGVQELRSELERAKRERRERELELVQEHESHRRDCEHRLASHELLVRRLTDSLADRDRLLQEYTELLRGSDQLPDGKGALIAALQQRLNEQHKLLERADEARSAALQHKEAEIVELRRELAERSLDLERLRALLAGKDETIQGLDELMRERDAELQRLASALKETRRARDEAGEALDGSLADAERARALLAQRETELEVARQALLERAEVGAQELVRRLTERLADKERLLEQARSEGGRPSGDALREGRRLAELLAQLRDKEECLEAERAERACQQREMEQLRRRLAEVGGERWTEREGDAERVKEEDPGRETLTHVELGRLHAVLQEKDSIIHRLVENGQEKDRLLTLVQAPPRTLELKQTLRILKDERDKETRQNLLGEEEEEDVEDDVSCDEEDEEDEEEEEGGDDDKTVPPRAVRRQAGPAGERAALRHLLVPSPEASRSQGALRPTQEVEILNKEVDRLTQEVHRLTQEVLVLRVRSPRNLVGAKPDTGSDAHELLLMEQEQEGRKLQQLLHAEQQVYQHLAALPQHADSRSLQEELARVRTLRLQLLDGLRANRELRHNLEELSRELETSPGGAGGDRPREA